MKPQGRYEQAIEEIFARHYREDLNYFVFHKDELIEVCEQLGITIRNIPDIIYAFRGRRSLPNSITSKGHWAIESAGTNAYAFRRLNNPPQFAIPFTDYAPIDIYNAIPEIVENFLRQDEQSLLTRILYNRLIDIFTGLTCFHLQNHYRSHIQDLGQVELDALYIGVNNAGQLFIIPVEAKSQSEGEMIGRVQISQMAKLVRQDFPDLQARLIAVKVLNDNSIGFVEFDDYLEPDEIGIVSVRRYRLFRRQREARE